MPQAIAFIATEISAFAANAAAAAGASSGVIEAVSSISYSVAAFGVPTAALYGLGAALQPKIPDPQALQTPLKQAMPVRQSAFGRVRVSGAYAFFGTGVGAAKALSIDIIALLDGRSDKIVSFYLNDDLMAPVGDYWWAPGAPGKYGGGGSNPPNLVQIDSRLGLDTETSYSEITPALPLWDASHRGDGVTSMALYCKPAKREDQAGDFPNGVPTPSAVIDAQRIFDPRDGTQTQGDRSTYKFSDNPVLCLLAYLTDASGGMGLDYARFIEPAIDLWKAAADECDGTVSTSGMHATLLDAAAAGDNKIFLADTTGLSVGATVHLPTEDATVSGFGLAGEVDLTANLAYAHAAGELCAWSGFGQTKLFRCAGTYSHATVPGEVIKQILSSFDGWLGQRGDGALVVRTNTVYEPTVTFTDRHIVGYTVQNYLPDEQVTNQFIVSYTDPASAFNKAEVGYVQDDADIAARGQVRSSELYLQWVPSAPQALTVAAAVKDRSTQPLRGTVTLRNLCGLPALGERYVKLKISDLAETADIIVEVTGKPSIDPQSMTVSFPWVLATASAAPPPPTTARVQEIAAWSARSATFPSAPTAGNVIVALGTGPAAVPVNTAEGWAEVDTHEGVVGSDTIYGVVAWKRAGSSESATQTPFSGAVSNNQDAVSLIELSNCADLPNALESLTWASPTSSAVPAVATATATTLAADDFAVAMGGWYYIWPYYDTMSLYGGWTNVSMHTGTNSSGVGNGSSAAIVGSQAVPAAGTTITADIETGHTYAVYDRLLACLMVFGRTARHSLSPLGPPSGSPLQPLTAPTITSVTPDYPDSGGGVQGARLDVVMVDPGLGAVTWRLQWKLDADTTWTLAATGITADGTPPEFFTGLIPATGVIDVQVAYELASQISPWSATTTVTVAAATPSGLVVSTSKSASFTTTADHNLYKVDTSAAAVTATLNATPAADEIVRIIDATGHAGTNPISLDGNGHTICGAATAPNQIQLAYGFVNLIFDATDNQWLTF